MLALAKCAYDACQLPDNNNRFILQGVYILIGIFVLLSDSKNFTYFQTMLFIFPILIDIVCSGPTNRLAWVVRWVIEVADTLIMIVCFLGLGGIIVQDDASYFIIESMLLFGGFRIDKGFIAVLLIANLSIPAAYYNYSPCKKSVKIKTVLMSKKEGKV